MRKFNSNFDLYWLLKFKKIDKHRKFQNLKLKKNKDYSKFV